MLKIINVKENKKEIIDIDEYKIKVYDSKIIKKEPEPLNRKEKKKFNDYLKKHNFYNKTITKDKYNELLRRFRYIERIKKEKRKIDEGINDYIISFLIILFIIILFNMYINKKYTKTKYTKTNKQK